MPRNRTAGVVALGLVTLMACGKAGVAEPGADAGATTPRDFQGFTRFALTTRLAMGTYDALLEKISDAEIVRSGTEYTLTSSVVVRTASPPVQCTRPNAHGYCATPQPLAARALGATEADALLPVFSKIAIGPRTASQSMCAIGDPGSIATYTWDGESATTNECGDRILDPASAEAITKLLEAFLATTCVPDSTRATTVQFEAWVGDYQGAAFQGVTARCTDGTGAPATTGADGRFSMALDLKGSPACGFDRCKEIGLTPPGAGAVELKLPFMKAFGEELALRRTP